MKLMGANECLSPASRNIVDDVKNIRGLWAWNTKQPKSNIAVQQCGQTEHNN